MSPLLALCALCWAGVASGQLYASNVRQPAAFTQSLGQAQSLGKRELGGVTINGKSWEEWNRDNGGSPPAGPLTVGGYEAWRDGQNRYPPNPVDSPVELDQRNALYAYQGQTAQFAPFQPQLQGNGAPYNQVNGAYAGSLGSPTAYQSAQSGGAAQYTGTEGAALPSPQASQATDAAFLGAVTSLGSANASASHAHKKQFLRPGCGCNRCCPPPTYVNPCPEVAAIRVAGPKPLSCAGSYVCPAGFWCHIGQSPDLTVCCRGQGTERCAVPMTPGSGQASLQRWYYEASTRTCRLFTYRGLYGNENNFLSKEACEAACPTWTNPCPSGSPIISPDSRRPQTCSPQQPCPSNFWCHLGASTDTTVCCPQTGDPCRLSFSVGTGESSLPRWYYASASRTCRAFNYRGLRGNSNNFLTREHCEAVCPVWENPCGQGQPILDADGRPRVCTPRSQLATSGEGSGCPINYFCHVGLDSATTACCARPGPDPCQQPVLEGQGQYSIPRWHFDEASRTCRQFSYRGLKGNENNFLLRSDCEEACPVFVNPCPTPLSGDQVTYCSAANPNTCPAGQWCHLGVDRDSSLCCPSAGDPCLVKRDRGTGSARLPRWAYDAASRTCRQFSYSGMGGNYNNFLSEADCERACPVYENPCVGADPLLVQGRPQTCSPQQPCPTAYWCHIGASTDTTLCCPNPQDPCALPISIGLGDSGLQRWSFNPQTLTCAPFTYRGLKGNQNSFLSQQDCERTCPVFRNPCAEGPPPPGPDGRPLQCQARQPGVCPRGYWCHVGEAADSTVCCPGAGNPCAMQQSRGAGVAQLPRWSYNSLTRQCAQFVYLGTMGNQNNFLTQADCEATCPVYINPCVGGDPLLDQSSRPVRCGAGNPGICGPGYWCHIGADIETTACCPGVEDPCQQAQTAGRGQAALPRFAFNAVARQCVPFTYRGLYGNRNNFLSLAECEATCPVFTNPCLDGEPPMVGGQPQYCSELSPNCPGGFYCHFGAERDTTVCCPARGDRCSSPLLRGSGPSSLPRWAYDSASRTCQPFAYAGLGGNENNFLSRRDCEEACPVWENPCPTGEPALIGGRPVRCSAGSGQCGAGFWCHLGASEETSVCCRGDLQQACAGLGPEQGQGSAALQRWYYELETRQCRQFTYRGAKGNANNFLSREECEALCPVWENPCPVPVQVPVYCSAGGYGDVCGPAQWCHVGPDRESTVCCPGGGDPCVLPQSPGQGQNALPRFFYDINSRTCVPFSYRGVKGNQNNFLSLEDCEATCPVFRNPCAMGEPYVGPDNQPQHCNALTNANSCPSDYWCHVGADYDTTVCCPGATDPCGLPMSTGTGNSALPRWYFNSNSQACEQFTYTGMGGNQNNFVSQQACRLQCRRFENPCVGQPAQSHTSGQPIFCSITNKDNCPVNFWCHIGARPETTLCCPGATNPCSVPLAPGTGTENLSRFYYNADNRQCVSFIYNGKGGNQNNFLTMSQCTQTCPVWENPCAGGEPAGGGRRPVECGGYFGGRPSCPAGFWCHVGSTQADSICCPGGVADVCSLRQARGTGKAQLQRWYFQSRSRRCTAFTYSGAGGNQNNFLTREDCLAECPEFENPCAVGEPEKEGGVLKNCALFLGPNAGCSFGYFCLSGDPSQGEPNYCCPSMGSDPCASPKEDGRGSKSLQRWYFNPGTRDCESFSYRGLKGNENNFVNRKDCETLCIPQVNPCFVGSEPYKRQGRNVLCGAEGQSCPAGTHYCHHGEDQFSTVCCPRRGDPCREQRLVGSGSSRLERWYYSSEDDACHPFTYTGRGGNENNFLSQDSCEEACPGFRGYCPHAKPYLVQGSPKECGVNTACPNNYVCHINTQLSRSVCCLDPAYFCVLARDPGPCTDVRTRFGYDRLSGTCRPYQHGGCGGNENSFDDLRTCTEICCDKGYK